MLNEKKRKRGLRKALRKILADGEDYTTAKLVGMLMPNNIDYCQAIRIAEKMNYIKNRHDFQKISLQEKSYLGARQIVGNALSDLCRLGEVGAHGEHKNKKYRLIKKSRPQNDS